MNVRHKRQEDFLFKAIYSNEVQGRYIKGAPLFNARYMKRVLFLSKMVYINFKSKCCHRSNISWQQLKIQFGPYSQVR